MSFGRPTQNLYTPHIFVKMHASHLFLVLAVDVQALALGRGLQLASTRGAASSLRAVSPAMSDAVEEEKIAKALKSMTGFANSYCERHARGPPRLAVAAEPWTRSAVGARGFDGTPQSLSAQPALVPSHLEPRFLAGGAAGSTAGRRETPASDLDHSRAFSHRCWFLACKQARTRAPPTAPIPRSRRWCSRGSPNTR